MLHLRQVGGYGSSSSFGVATWRWLGDLISNSSGVHCELAK